MAEPIATTLRLDQRTLPAQVFAALDRRALRMRDRKARAEEAWNSFGKPGRDPNRLGSVASLLAADGDWTPHLKIAQLNNHWDQVVGPAVAAHSLVDGFVDGVLVIRADSPAWTTQLTYLIPQLERTIRERLAGLDIRGIRVTGPRSGYRGRARIARGA